MVYLKGGHRTEKKSLDTAEIRAIDLLQKEWESHLSNGWTTQSGFVSAVYDYAVNDKGTLARLRHLSPYEMMISTHGSNTVYGTQFVPPRVRNAVKNYVDERIIQLVKSVLRGHLTE